MAEFLPEWEMPFSSSFHIRSTQTVNGTVVTDIPHPHTTTVDDTMPTFLGDSNVPVYYTSAASLVGYGGSFAGSLGILTVLLLVYNLCSALGLLMLLWRGVIDVMGNVNNDRDRDNLSVDDVETVQTDDAAFGIDDIPNNNNNNEFGFNNILDTDSVFDIDDIPSDNDDPLDIYLNSVHNTGYDSDDEDTNRNNNDGDQEAPYHIIVIVINEAGNDEEWLFPLVQVTWTLDRYAAGDLRGLGFFDGIPVIADDHFTTAQVTIAALMDAELDHLRAQMEEWLEGTY